MKKLNRYTEPENYIEQMDKKNTPEPPHWYVLYVAIPMGFLTLFSLGGVWVVPLMVFMPDSPFLCIMCYAFLLPSLFFMFKKK